MAEDDDDDDVDNNFVFFKLLPCFSNIRLTDVDDDDDEGIDNDGESITDNLAF